MCDSNFCEIASTFVYQVSDGRSHAKIFNQPAKIIYFIPLGALIVRQPMNSSPFLVSII